MLILLGDCIEMMRTLPEQSVDSVVTSPPYATQRAKFYDSISEDKYPKWTTDWMREVKRIIKPKGSVLINIRENVRNGEISDYVHRTRLALRADGWVECDELIWVKPASPPVGHPRRPRRSWERILWFSLDRQPYCNPKANGNPHGRIGYDKRSINSVTTWVNGASQEIKYGACRCPDYYECAVGVEASSMKNIAHPAKYPVRFAAWMIRLVTPPGGTVLDPFCGSGSTLVAAVKEGFDGIGIDNNPAYVKLAAARVEAAATEER